jgi:hypothetical protein
LGNPFRPATVDAAWLAWNDGTIPDDIRVLSRLCRLEESVMATVWPALDKFFPVVEPGKRGNRFMWIEREKVIADLEQRSDEGTRNARKRWDEAKRKSNTGPNAAPIRPPNELPMQEPMQDQTRPEQTRPGQTRAEASNATGMGEPSASAFNSTEIAQILCQQNGWSGKGMIWSLQAAIEFQAKRMPDRELEEVGEWLLRAYSDHKSAKGTFAVGPQRFFEQGLYCPSMDRREAKAKVLTDNPATRALAQMEAS